MRQAQIKRRQVGWRAFNCLDGASLVAGVVVELTVLGHALASAPGRHRCHRAPEQERLAPVMFKLKGLTHEEIGRRLGVPRHSAPRYLSRALAKCAQAMQAFEGAGLEEIRDDQPKGEKDRT